MSDEEDELIRRLQAKADALREKPLDILLANDPGPYQLPLCTRVSVNILDSHTAELILDTEKGQRILIPLSSDAFESLHKLLSFVLKTDK